MSKRTRTVLMFTPFGARWMKGTEEFRVMAVKGYGGNVINRGAIIPYYHGRTVLPKRDPDSALMARKMTPIMVMRQGDPHTVSLSAGRANRYQSELMTEARFDQFVEEAMQTAKAEAGQAAGLDPLTRALLMLVALAAGIAGLIWLAIPVTKMVRG